MSWGFKLLKIMTNGCQGQAYAEQTEKSLLDASVHAITDSEKNIRDTWICSWHFGILADIVPSPAGVFAKSPRSRTSPSYIPLDSEIRPPFNFVKIGHVYLKSSLLIVKLSIRLQFWSLRCLVMVLTSTQSQRCVRSLQKDAHRYPA